MKKKKSQCMWMPPSMPDEHFRRIFKADKKSRGDISRIRWKYGSFLFSNFSSYKADAEYLQKMFPEHSLDFEKIVRAHPIPLRKPKGGFGMGVPLDYETDAELRARCLRWLIRLKKVKEPSPTSMPLPKIKPLPHADNSAQNGKWTSLEDWKPDTDSTKQGQAGTP